MSGQSASLSISEAKALQNRITCGPDSQGKKGTSKAGHEVMKKEKKGK